MPAFSVPDTAFFKRSLSAFTVRDLVYGLLVLFMLTSQHFNNEDRMRRLEDSNVQLTAIVTKLSNRMDSDMVTHKENDDKFSALDVRLGNIEKGQSNMMTYLLNKK